MSEVLLTGASGFLGSHLLRELCAAGHTVRALSRRTASDAAITALGGVPVRATLADAEALASAVAGCEAVFHAAADTSLWRQREAAQLATNVTGTANLLRAAEQAGVRAFMHTSSVSAYSHLVHGTIDESVPQRGGDSWIGYERSKYLGEQRVRASNVPWIIFNPSHILGPGDRRNWARLIMLVDRGTLPGIPPGMGPFADVREVARAQLRAWQRQMFGQSYLLGGEHAAFVEFVQRVGVMLGKRTPRKATPAWALNGYGRLAEAWSRLSGREPEVTRAAAVLTSHALRVDSGKARHELDYIETPLDSLLTDTLAWLRDQGLIGGSVR